jgi:hypothetical protein
VYSRYLEYEKSYALRDGARRGHPPAARIHGRGCGRPPRAAASMATSPLGPASERREDEVRAALSAGRALPRRGRRAVDVPATPRALCPVAPTADRRLCPRAACLLHWSLCGVVEHRRREAPHRGCSHRPLALSPAAIAVRAPSPGHPGRRRAPQHRGCRTSLSRSPRVARLAPRRYRLHRTCRS